jgi:hypothetical protein
MRRVPQAAVATLVALSLGSSAAAAQAPGDSVTGGASTFFEQNQPQFFISFSFDAHSGPSGEDPTGSARWEVRSPFGDFAGGGQVTCLNVHDGVAIVGTFSGNTVTLFLAAGSVGFGAYESSTPATVCPSFLSNQGFSQYFEPRPMENNSITIVDSPPMPTTKDQCRDGGWRAFGVFKNQGDCVSFVATGGGNPAAGG